MQLVDYDGDVEDALNRCLPGGGAGRPVGGLCGGLHQERLHPHPHHLRGQHLYLLPPHPGTDPRPGERHRGQRHPPGGGGGAPPRSRASWPLRVAYFVGDAASIAELVHQAYYDTPAAALGMPAVEIALYPDTGIQRIVEILLSYPGDADALPAEKRGADRRPPRPLCFRFRPSAIARTAVWAC